VTNTRETAQFTETMKQKPKESEDTKKGKTSTPKINVQSTRQKGLQILGREEYTGQRTPPQPDGRSRASWKSLGVKKRKLDFPRKKEIW
jgi:hypothetical protein